MSYGHLPLGDCGSVTRALELLLRIHWSARLYGRLADNTDADNSQPINAPRADGQTNGGDHRYAVSCQAKGRPHTTFDSLCCVVSDVITFASYIQ